MEIKVANISFPEIKLKTRDGHKLRGYFGSLFKQHSEILHNHFYEGGYNYKYPLVQYKILNHQPYLVGINEGAELLVNLFLKIGEIQVDDKIFSINSKNIYNENYRLEELKNLHQYTFKTLWMGLNQQNYKKYVQLGDDQKQQELERILTGNILSFYKGIGFRTQERIMVTANLQEKITQFKNQKMLAFSGSFTTNALLPDNVGLGKSVARGFGTIQRKSS